MRLGVSLGTAATDERAKQWTSPRGLGVERRELCETVGHGIAVAIEDGFSLGDGWFSKSLWTSRTVTGAACARDYAEAGLPGFQLPPTD